MSIIPLKALRAILVYKNEKIKQMRKFQILILSIFISQITFSQIEVAGNYQKHDSIKAYVDFLEQPHLSAKDYIISLFDCYEELPNPEDALTCFNQRYNGEKQTHMPNLDVLWTEILKWTKEKPTSDSSGNNVPFSTFDDGNSLTSFVGKTWKWFKGHAQDAGFTLNPPLQHSLMTTPLLVYFDGRNNSMHYPLWSELDAQSKTFFNQIAGNDETEARKIFGLFFNGFYIPHEMAHYLSHISGDKARLHSYEGEQFANELAMVVWREIMPERALKNVYESAKNILPKLKNPVPAGENEAEWFSKNYNQIVASKDPYTYGYFQFSQIVKIYEDEALKRQTLDGFLEEYKKGVNKLK